MRNSPRITTAAALALGLASATLATAASAAPPPPHSPPPGGGTSVTLVTGDRAVVSATGSAYLVPADPSDVGYTTRTQGKDTYLVPDRAVPLIRSGRLDEELFNVTGLVRQGYDDARRRTIPLIVTSGDGATLTRGAGPALGGVVASTPLPSANATAVEAGKDKAGELWKSLTGANPNLRGVAGYTKVWLDRKVTASLDRSVAQIGAPQAWAAGFDGTGTKVAVLDTGADTHHPDLLGQIAGSRDFTGKGDVEDGNGHGTHTASTVAGTGAASNGLRRGVAPGAKLLIGKVLSDGGAGQESWIIGGMEWAVEQGADVVSMSLGSAEPTDCTDPMSVAAESLAAKSLFVIAAGNSYTRETVNSPGCASSVLTVGAVDRDNKTAPFSSKGPVLGSHAVKPEIAAPGVDIMAANAGSPGGVAYQAMSGTSMATPHVAGAAAILAQRRPTWSAQDRKAALVSAAKPGATGGIYEQGAGVVDVPRSIGAQVVSDGPVNVGSWNWPHEGQKPQTKDITYRNLGTTPVTLSLESTGFAGVDGKALPARMVKLGARTVTVPAGGSATVPVTVDPTARLASSALGEMGGRVVATGPGGVVVTTPVGFWLEEKTVTLTVKVLDRRGQAPGSPSFLDVINTDVARGERRYLGGDTEVYRLRAGSYSISTMIGSPDADAVGADNLVRSVAYLGDPEITLDKDTTLVYDARTTTRTRVFSAEDRPLRMSGALLQYGRWWGENWTLSGGVSTGGYVRELYSAPTKPVHQGGFELGTFLRMAAPELVLRTGGDLLDPTYLQGSPKLDGKGAAEVTADPAAARGRALLVRATDDTDVSAVLASAAAAGATAVLFGHDAPGRWVAFDRNAPIPALTVTTTEYAALAREKRIAWTGTPDSPYVYNLAYVDDRAVSALPWHFVAERDLATVTENWYAQRTPGALADFVSVHRPHLADAGFVGGQYDVKTGRTRTAYYSAGDTAWVHGAGSTGFFGETFVDVPRTYAKGQRRSEDWYKGPMTSGIPYNQDTSVGLFGERQANLIGASVGSWSDNTPGHTGYGNFGDVGNSELFRDGVSLGDTGWFGGVWEVPAEAADYRLKLSTARFNPGPPFHTGWEMWFATDTTFTFRSARPSVETGTALPLVWPTYDVPVDLLNLAPASAGFAFTVGAVGQQGYQMGTVTVAARVSYDDGGTWAAAPVAGRTVTVDNRPAAGGHVSLRVTLTDSHGNTTEQTVIRAYGVR